MPIHSQDALGQAIDSALFSSAPHQIGMASPRKPKTADVESAAIPAEELDHVFPRLNLPLQPPYPPAEAKSVKDLPREAGWFYEPKWDGFRCLAFRQGDEVVLQSKAGQPLGRYFPEIVAALLALPARKFVLDGEIVIRQGAGLDFDALLQRIHPAASRIQRLSQEMPATYMIFDLLVDGRLFENKGRSLAARPLSARRMALQEFAASNIKGEPDRRRSKKATLHPTLRSGGERIMLSPASSDFATAEKWMREGATRGWDGVVAKRLNCKYMSGERTGMVKIKHIRTADCVVGGFRWARGAKSSSGEAADSKANSKTADSRKRPTDEVGSLLLGLYNKNGELDHIGFSASFTREERRKLKSILKLFMGGAGFSGKAPGGPSRWTRDARDTEWFPLKPKLVGEFQYDHFSSGRFRHGTKFLRWRPEKKPEQCTMEQIRPGKRAA
ncbi:MAG TPA: ATP-dependent DNA ligase [Candidatus Polarisedimenticolia bacterium]|nr:ATP-dependent DNA ligase [Candidatus Polarisedimenticolia bacterium]